MGSCFSFDEATKPTTQPIVSGGKPSPSSPTTPTPRPPSRGGVADPSYKTLPRGSKKCSVHHVYDGDTLTLTDQRRVRLLGVDCPEMKPPQPFAQEAKQYTKSRCDKQEVWLLETGQDHYGRTLAHIFVHQNGAFLCVNEGLVANGLAYTYIPKKDEETFNWEKLLKLQHEARSTKLGVWKSFHDKNVVKTTNGSAYHDRSCSHISNIRNLQQLKVSAATDMGLHPCRTCMADA